MTERCPDCGRLLGNCFFPGDRHCLRVAVSDLQAQAQRDQETIAAARKCIEAADGMREAFRLEGQTAPIPYDAARAEFDKVTLDGGESKP